MIISWPNMRKSAMSHERASGIYTFTTQLSITKKTQKPTTNMNVFFCTPIVDVSMALVRATQLEAWEMPLHHEHKM